MDVLGTLSLDQQHELIVALIAIVQGAGWWLADRHAHQVADEAIRKHCGEAHYFDKH